MPSRAIKSHQEAIKWPSSGHQVAIKVTTGARSMPIVAHLLQHRDVCLERLDTRAEFVILGFHSAGGRARLGK